MPPPNYSKVLVTFGFATFSHHCPYPVAGSSGTATRAYSSSAVRSISTLAEDEEGAAEEALGGVGAEDEDADEEGAGELLFCSLNLASLGAVVALRLPLFVAP